MKKLPNSVFFLILMATYPFTVIGIIYAMVFFEGWSLPLVLLTIIYQVAIFWWRLGIEEDKKKKRRRKPQSAISPSVLSLILIFGFIILVGILLRVLVPAEVMKQLLSNPYL